VDKTVPAGFRLLRLFGATLRDALDRGLGWLHSGVNEDAIRIRSNNGCDYTDPAHRGRHNCAADASVRQAISRTPQVGGQLWI
jgi:hypothetical protein